MAQIKDLKLTDEILTADETSSLVQTAKDEITKGIASGISTENVTASKINAGSIVANGSIKASSVETQVLDATDCVTTREVKIYCSDGATCAEYRYDGVYAANQGKTSRYVFDEGDDGIVRFKDLTNLGGSAIDSTRLSAVETKAKANENSITDLGGRVTRVENGLTNTDERVTSIGSLASSANECVQLLSSAVKQVADSYCGVNACLSYLASTKQEALTESIVASNLGSADPDNEDAVVSGTDQANLVDGGFLMGTLAELDVTGGASAIMPEEISLFRRAGTSHPNLYGTLFLRVLRWDGDEWYVAYQATSSITHDNYTLNGQRMRHPMGYVAGSVYIPVDEVILIGYAEEQNAPASNSLAPTGLRLALRGNSSVKHTFGRQTSLPTSPYDRPTTGDQYAHVFAMVVAGKGQADLANALGKKQDTVTAGDGIAINNGAVSVRLAHQKSALCFSGGGLTVNVSCTRCDSYAFAESCEQLYNTFVDSEGFLVVLPPDDTTYGVVKLDSGTLSTEAYTAATGTAVKAELEKYYTKEEVETEFEKYYTKEEVETSLGGKQDKLTPGVNISIVNGVISATGGSGGAADLTNYYTKTEVDKCVNDAKGGVLETVAEKYYDKIAIDNKFVDDIPLHTHEISEVNGLEERLASAGGSGTVDETLSNTSTNPVQNQWLGKRMGATEDNSVQIGYNAKAGYWREQAIDGADGDNGKQVAVGRNADGSSDGVAVGYNADGAGYGTAVGLGAKGCTSGAAVGAGAKGYGYGVAVGLNAEGYGCGTAVGYKAKGADFKVAVGYEAEATDDTPIVIGTDNYASAKITVSKEGVLKVGGKEVGRSGGSITVDSELSDTSENPVQNKVIKFALDDVAQQFNLTNIDISNLYTEVSAVVKAVGDNKAEADAAFASVDFTPDVSIPSVVMTVPRSKVKTSNGFMDGTVILQLDVGEDGKSIDLLTGGFPVSGGTYESKFSTATLSYVAGLEERIAALEAQLVSASEANP